MKTVISVAGCLLLTACGTAAPRASAVETSEPTSQSHAGGAEADPEPVHTSRSLEPEDPPGMVLIPGGTFMMGNDEGDPDQRPAHQVTLSPYFLDRTEVTVAAYTRCVDAGVCTPPTGLGCVYNSSAEEWPNRDQQAITCVSWDQARTYCESIGGRLPTEAEWEFAARGTDGRLFPWGNEPPREGLVRIIVQDPCLDHESEYALCADEQAPDPPVGAYPAGASPFGVLDMAGSVREWVADWYGPYSAEPTTNPSGPSEGTERVMRGGGDDAWRDEWLQATNRDHVDPEWHGPVTIRCARTAAGDGAP